MPSDVSSNLVCYDVLRYSPSDLICNLKELYFQTRGQLLGQEVKRRILLGTFVLSSGYYESYYKKARMVQALIKKEFEEVFKDIDLLILPTTPTPAFRFGEKTNNPLEMYLSDVFTVPANIAGIPAVSVPIWSDKEKLPYGLQFFAEHFNESLLLNAAYLFEKQSYYGRFH